MDQKSIVSGKIHYVGVNDRVKPKFEALWPLPYGVSYNSYLINDETIALVDTVDICYFEIFLAKIKKDYWRTSHSILNNQSYGAGSFRFY